MDKKPRFDSILTIRQTAAPGHDPPARHRALTIISKILIILDNNLIFFDIKRSSGYKNFKGPDIEQKQFL